MRRRAVIAPLLLAAALVVSTLVPASADDLVDKKQRADQQVAAAQSDLESSSAAIRRVASALTAVRDQLPAARAAYADAAGRVSDARDRLDVIRDRLRQLRSQREALLGQVSAAQRDIASTETLMGDIVRQQYQAGGMSELAVVLDASSPSDFVQRMLTTQQVLDSQSAMVDQLTADKAVLQAKEQAVQVTSDGIQVAAAQALQEFKNLQQAAAEARAAKQAIERLVAQREQALRVARERRNVERARYERAVAAQKSLQQQIAAATAVPGTSTGNGIPSGELLWPVPGSVVQGVGWRIHPVYGYRSCHTGDDISSGSGTPIRAAADGVVVWTQGSDSDPFGLNTLIDHGGGLSTFYAHQSAFNVSPGQRVSKGQVIGYVGATGYVTGPHLHFEVRINGLPYDPMGWFGGSKTPKTQFCP